MQYFILSHFGIHFLGISVHHAKQRVFSLSNFATVITKTLNTNSNEKTLLLLAAALISASAFSQTVTKVSADGSDKTNL